MSFDITLGNILTILAIVAGFIFQYVAFSNRMSKFEGYTKAKLEAFERDIDNLWQLYRKLTEILK